MKIGELFVALGFKIEGSENLKDADTGLRESALNATKAAIAVDALNAAFFVMMQSAARAAQSLQNFVLATGLSADQLQLWQHTAAMSGISADALTTAIKGLQNARTQFALGEPEAVGAWSLLGVDPRQDPFQVLTALRASLRQFKDVGIVRNLLGKVGLEELAPILRGTNAEFEKWSRSFLLTQKQTADLARLNAAWQSLKVSITSVRNIFAALFAPTMEQLGRVLEFVAEKLADFLQWLNKGSPVATAIKWVLIGIAGALVLLGAALTALVGIMGLVTAAFIALNIAASPWLLIAGLIVAGMLILGATIAAIILELDDFWTFLKGGDSVIGHLGDYMKAFFDEEVRRWNSWVNLVKDSITTVRDFLKGATIFGAIEGSVGKIAGMIRGGAPSSSTTHNNVQIHVDGSGDPQAVGRAIVSSLRQELNNANFQAPVASY